MIQDFGENLEPTREVDIKVEDGLELNLSVIEELASKYEREGEELKTYDLTTDEAQEFTLAYNGSRGELITRSEEYRRSLTRAPLYPQDLKGKIYKLVDQILKQQSFRENERVRMLNTREIPNPYVVALEYIDVTIKPLVVHKQVQPELLHIAVNSVRGFDKIAKENIKTYQQGI